MLGPGHSCTPLCQPLSIFITLVEFLNVTTSSLNKTFLTVPPVLTASCQNIWLMTSRVCTVDHGLLIVFQNGRVYELVPLVLGNDVSWCWVHWLFQKCLGNLLSNMYFGGRNVWGFELQLVQVAWLVAVIFIVIADSHLICILRLILEINYLWLCEDVWQHFLCMFT